MPLTDSLVAYWKCDEASGDLLDAHGSNTLTETSGTIAAATGKISGARDFEAGDTEYGNIADNTALSMGDIDFTIALWVQLESLANMYAVAKWNNGVSNEYAVGYATAASKFRFNYSSNGTSNSALDAATPTPAVAGTWYFVVAYHDSVNDLVGISVNNATPTTASHTFGVHDGNAAFTMGQLGAGIQYWDGLIDEVGIWKRVLTSDERTQLYNSGNGLAYPFLTGITRHVMQYAA